MGDIDQESTLFKANPELTWTLEEVGAALSNVR